MIKRKVHRPLPGQVMKFTDRVVGERQGVVRKVWRRTAMIVTRAGEKWKVDLDMLSPVH